MEVHRHLGPGFMERVYEDALCYELDLRGIPFEQQMPVSVFYKGVVIGGQRLDLVVGRSVIAELKAVQEIVPLHKAQLLSYLKATEMRLGYVLNFNVHIFKQGIKRMVL